MKRSLQMHGFYAGEKVTLHLCFKATYKSYRYPIQSKTSNKVRLMVGGWHRDCKNEQTVRIKPLVLNCWRATDFWVLGQYQVGLITRYKNFTYSATALHTVNNKLSITFLAGVKYSCFIESGSEFSSFCCSDWIIDKNGALFMCNCYQWCFWERTDCICHERFNERSLVRVS